MMVARPVLTTLNGEFRSFRHDTSTKILCIFAIATAPVLRIFGIVGLSVIGFKPFAAADKYGEPA